MALVAGSSPAGRTILQFTTTKEIAMRTQPIALPAAKPRNRVVIALALLARAGSGRHTQDKRRKDKARKDLADRVRELGEW